VLEHALSEEERSQILQAIEMFEVIAQSQKDDYQSLEILKVAYQKLGKTAEALKVSRRLAEAYHGVGSFSLALQECEAVLAVEPNAPEILAMLGEIENRLQSSDQSTVDPGLEHSLIEKPEYRASSAPATASGLLEPGGRNTGQVIKRILPHDPDQGNDALGKFLVVQQLFPEDEVKTALAAVKEANAAISGQTLGTSLLDWLCKADDEKMERVLSALIDRTKFAYVPLEYYDVDRQVVRMLPDELTINRLYVPFDLISRTIMVAVCNPFDSVGREAVQKSLDYTVTWYLAKPATVIKTLQEIHRLEARV
jgi:tetratricopeptide (TPR) repeat protein